jgi:hypothetical protein
VLDDDEELSHIVGQRLGKQHARGREFELVDVAERGDAGVALGDAAAVTEAGRAVIAGAGRDLRQAIRHGRRILAAADRRSHAKEDRFLQCPFGRAAEDPPVNAPLPAHLMPRLAPRAVPAEMIEALKRLFGDRCSTALAVREQHGRDESPLDAPPPEAVVFCESTDEVVQVVKLADRHAVPVIPFGVGSSLEGHLLAVQGGVSIDLSRMNRVSRSTPRTSPSPFRRA